MIAFACVLWLAMRGNTIDGPSETVELRVGYRVPDASERAEPPAATMDIGHLVRPIVPGTRTFWPALQRDPSRVCPALAGDAPAPEWTAGALNPNTFECVANMGGDATGYSIFAIARGRNEDRVDSVLAKLNVIDADHSDDAKQAFLSRITDIAGTLGVDFVPADGGMSVDDEINRRAYGIRIKLIKERLEGERYVFVLDLPDEESPAMARTDHAFGP